MKTSTKIWMCLAGIALVALGVLCIVYPLSTLIALSWVIGFVFFAAGCSSIGAWSKLRRFVPQSGLMLFAGLLQILLGCLLVFNPIPLTVALPFIFAFWLLIEGVNISVSAFDFKRIGLSYWWALFFIGIAAACFGIYGLIDPVVSGEAIAVITGVGIIIDGVGYWVKVAIINKSEKKLKSVGERLQKAMKDIQDVDFEEVK